MARFAHSRVLFVLLAVVLAPGGCEGDSTDTSDDESLATTVDPPLLSRGLQVAPDGDAVRLAGAGAPLRLRSTLPVELGAFRKEGDRLVRSSVEGFGEAWDAVGAGVRQSWYFPRDPTPGEDLVVDIEIENGRAVARTREGIILGSAQTGPFAYSDAVWIGADGARTPIGAAYLDSSIELRVPASVLEGTAFPAWLDPTISASLDPFVPVPTLKSPSPYTAGISCNATRCRIGFDFYPSNNRRGIVTNTDGVVLTPISSLIAAGLPDSYSNQGDLKRSIAHIGSTFLVVWRSGSTTVRAQRFSEAGAPLDATSFVLSTNASSANTGGPAITASNTNFMATWVTASATLEGRLIDVDGVVGPTTAIGASSGALRPDAASDGNGFAIAAVTGSNQVRLITTDASLGFVANTNVGSVGSTNDAPRVAWDGTSYVVGWRSSNGLVRRVSTAGALLAAESNLGPTSTLRLACRPGDCLVILRNSGTISSQALLTGVPAGAPVALTSGDLGDITTDGSDYQLLWSNGGLRMSRLSLQGVLEMPAGSPVGYVGNELQNGRLTTAPSGNLASASTGSSCVTAFISPAGVAGPEGTLGSCSGSTLLEEGSNGFLQVVGDDARILDAGASSPTAPINITGGGAEWQSDAYWNGGDFMLVNEASGTHTHLKRFSTAGALLGSTVLTPGSQPRGAGTPVGGLVTSLVGGNQTVRAVDPLGVATSPVVTLGASTIAGDVAWGGTNGGVTWASSTAVFFQRLDQAASPLDAFAATVAANQTAPRIAWDGAGYLVAFRAPTTPYAIRARRMRADGVAEGSDFGLSIPASQDFGVVGVPGVPGGGRAAVYSTGFWDELHANRLIMAYVDADAVDGTPCTSGSSCQSGFCVDGVCCATACGGGAIDCQACSVTGGGQSDGQCTPLADPAATVCRAAAGPCDVAESCAAGSTACPPDAFAADTLECRAANGACDVAELCSGIGAQCPSDTLVPASTVCRAAAGTCDTVESCSGSSPQCPADQLLPAGGTCRLAAGACDVVEACDGSSPTCPADAVVASGTQCRAGDGSCDPAESCDGSSPVCPADMVAPDGTTCDDATACFTGEACQAGACVAGAPLDCDDGDPCTNDGCDAVSGCANTAVPDGTPCSGGTCQRGECTPTGSGGGGAGGFGEGAGGGNGGSGGIGGAGVGGESTSNGGSSNDAGSSASGDGDGDGSGGADAAGDGGCGCRVAGVRSPASWWLAFGVLALLVGRRRRTGGGERGPAAAPAPLASAWKRAVTVAGLAAVRRPGREPPPSGEASAHDGWSLVDVRATVERAFALAPELVERERVIAGELIADPARKA